jgi:glycerol-3-phosphate acyltransferase PlsY
MQTVVAYAISIALAYLLGSIPVGLIVVRALTGQDIRDFGSGRTGGTNAGRAGGRLAGILTGLGDFLNGVGAVNIARIIWPGAPVLEAACGVAAVLGHNYSIYIGFRGGAGTGPNVGAASALWPWAIPILAPAVPLILVLTGYASVTSTSIAVGIVLIFLVRAIFFGSSWAYVGYAAATTLLVGIALIPNYRRLIDGTERRVGKRAKAAAQRSD